MNLLQKTENVFKPLEAGKLASGNAKRVNEEKLSDDVKKLRTRKVLIGTTFKEIAEVSGYNKGYVYRIFCGKHNSQNAIDKIMAALDKIEKDKSDQPVVTMGTENGYVIEDVGKLLKAEKHFSVGASVQVPMEEVPSNPFLDGIVNTAREYIKIFGNTIQNMEFELYNKEVHFVVEIKDKEV